jgi:F0F1-type ATP synthase delta subunit
MENKKQQKELEQTLKTLQKTLKDLGGMTNMLEDMKSISEKLKFLDDIDEDTDPEEALNKMKHIFEEEDQQSEEKD